MEPIQADDRTVGGNDGLRGGGGGVSIGFGAREEEKRRAEGRGGRGRGRVTEGAGEGYRGGEEGLGAEQRHRRVA